MKLVARLAAFCVLLLVALVIAPIGRIGWFEALISEHKFSTSLVWFNPPQAISWGFEVLFFFVFGMLIARLFRFSAPIAWAFAFGAICGAFHFWLSKEHFTPEAPSSIYVWVYGNYVMPAVGAVLGALALQLAPNFSSNRTAAVELR